MAKLHKQIGSRCFVSGLQLPAWWPNLLEHQWEFDFGVVELLSALPLAKLCGDGGSLDNLNARKPDSVSRCHLSVHLLDSPI